MVVAAKEHLTQEHLKARKIQGTGWNAPKVIPGRDARARVNGASNKGEAQGRNAEQKSYSIPPRLSHPSEIAPTGRHSAEPKQGVTEEEQWATSCLRAALIWSEIDGKNLAFVAQAINVCDSTMRSWIEPSKPKVIPTKHLVSLLTNEQALSPAARRLLWEKLAGLAGLKVEPIEAVGDDGASVGMQTLELSEAIGKISGVVKAIEDRESPGGQHVTSDEAQKTIPFVKYLMRECEQFLGTLEAIARRDAAVASGDGVVGGRVDVKG